MKFTFLTLLSFALFAPFLHAQNGTSGGQNQQGKINWTVDPFEHALFVENKGQFDTVAAGGKILYESHLGAASAFFTANGILFRHIETEKLDFSNGKDADADGPPDRNFYYLTAQWEGANLNPTITASDEQSYYYTYPNGYNSTIFANVFKKITYKNLYPGIDIVYSFPGDSSNLEYTIIVHPGGDLSKVHLKYLNSNGVEVDGAGKVVVKTEFATMTESSPVSYYLENKQSVNIKPQVTGSDETFAGTNLDNTKTLIVDPAIVWTTNPAFSVAPDYAFDLDYDNLGNVYVYGGGIYPFQLVKLSPGGAIQWVFNATLMTSTSNFYGDFAVDKHSLESYIVEGWNSGAGGGSRIEKIASNGGLAATYPGNAEMNEMWRIQSTVCPAGFVIFGNGTGGPFQAAMVDTTMATLNPANILGGAVTTGNHDMCLIGTDPLGGSAYTATTVSLLNAAVDPADFVKVPIPALAPNNYLVPDKFAFKELLSISYTAGAQFNAMNGMACGLNFLYAYNGDTVKQINKASGAIINVAKVSTTPYTWGGLDVDVCGNVYVANDQVVEIMGPTLNLTGALPPLSGIIYDFVLGPYTSQLGYACGQGFVSQISLAAPIPTAITIQKGNTTCAPCSGIAKATLMLCANPDSTNVTYRWSDGETTRTAEHLCAGVDTVTISIGCSLIFKDTVTIRIASSTITLSLTQVNATCNTLGSANVIPAGGSAPYTYSWTPIGQTNANATGLSAGTYTITVTDKNTCTASATVTITQPSVVTVTAVNTNEKCSGNATATATATPLGGTAPYTYAWTPTGGTNATATGLSIGTYTITVKDNNGCIATTTVTITQPVLLTANMGVPTNVKCNGGATGSVTVTAAGGTIPYTYAWNPSAKTTATATGLSAGTYTCTVTDNNGCTATASVTITQPTILTATMGVPTNDKCNGGNTGSATVTGGGGTPGYTYNWTPNGGTGATGTGLTAGTYTATITDANGCTATASVTITQPTLVTATISAITNVSCNGGNNGHATVTAGGGTPGYTYLWTPIGGNTTTGTGFSAGTYTVTVTDANGCTGTAPVTITQPAGMVLSTTSTQSTCGNNNGTATVTIIGGNPAYTYSWNPSAQTTPTATGLSLGTYTITVTDANGCSQTATATVTSPFNLSASITASTNILCNGNLTGSATVTAAGGVLPYTYSWTPSAQTTPTATGLSAGTYTSTVQDNKGCSIINIVTITQPPLLTATMGAPTNILCNGGPGGNATVTAGGGTPGYTYNWAPNGGTGATGTGLSAGTYTATVTDANGCTASANVTITQPSLLTATISASANILCNGGTTGSATVSAAGGTPAYNYVWTPAGGNTANATGLSANTYTIIVTDANGCTATSSITLTEPTAITLTTTSTQVTCGNNNGTATVNPLGGTPGYVYSWAPGGQSNATATGLAVGLYTITVTDANGCTQTSTANVTSPSNLTASITASTNLLCNGDANGSATVTAAGGTGPYTYSWNPSAQTTPTATGLTAAVYVVTVTDNTGCSVVATITITQPMLLTANISATTNVLCAGGNTGTSTVTAGGGTPGYTYNWTPIGGTGATGTGFSAGTYTVTVTDANGCTATNSVSITEPTVLAANISATNNITCSGLNNGSLAVTASGGTPAYIYNWTPAGGSSAIASALSAGSYTVNVTDAYGCTSSATGTITEPAALSSAITNTGDITCFGGNNGTLTVTPAGGTTPYTYAWAPNGGNAATASTLTVGSYTVTVTDANGCTTTSSGNITEPTLLTVTASGPSVICAGSNANLTSNPAGGTAPYTYAWTPAGGNAQNANVVVSSTTTYTVTVTDAHGCTASATITVTTGPPLVATISGAASFCPGGFTTLGVTVTGGSNYTYQWMPGNFTTQNITVSPSSTTTYTVTVKDACGSVVSIPVTVTVNPSPAVNFMAIPSSGCAPLCVQFRNMTTIPTGGISDWQWNFGNNETSTSKAPNFCYQSPGSYNVSLTAISDSGCSSTLNITDMVNVYQNPNASFSYSPEPVDIFAPTVQFTNTTSDQYSVIYWNWSFGDGKDSISDIRDPIHTYGDTGTYCATLKVMDIHGCESSYTNCIEVNPVFTFYIPDAFSPNGDGINDVFMPKGSFIRDYEMYIFDRWGMKLFYSNDIFNGWPGTVGKDNAICQEDTYVYLINVTDTKGMKHSFTGKVTLIK